MVRFYSRHKSVVITINTVCNVALSVIGLQALTLPAKSQPVDQPSSASEEVLSTKILIEVKSSLSRLEAGNGTSITGRLTNISDKPVYIKETSTVLTLPLEAEYNKNKGVSGYYAYFPTEFHGFNKLDKERTREKYFKNCLAIKPKESYTVFWTPWSKGENIRDGDPLSFFRYLKAGDYSSFFHDLRVGDRLSFFRYQLFFVPQSYSMVANIKYWEEDICKSSQESTNQESTNFRTYTKSELIQIDTPLMSLILGAMLGGFLCWGLKLVQSPEEKGAKITQNKQVLSLVAALLLSIIVTVLLSRIKDTGFIINVTVNDFWGAIATGFIANYIGVGWLGKLILPNDKDELTVDKQLSMKSGNESEETTSPALAEVQTPQNNTPDRNSP